MKYLTLLFISSCGMNQLQSSYERKYTVTMHEYCPNHYIMAQDVTGRRFCVLDNNLMYHNKTEIIYNDTLIKNDNFSKKHTSFTNKYRVSCFCDYKSKKQTQECKK